MHPPDDRPASPLDDATVRSLVHGALDGVFVTDADGRYLYANPAGCALLGYTLEELTAMTVYDVVVPNDPAALRLRLDAMLAGEALSSTRLLARKDGSILRAELRSHRLDAKRLCSFVRDIGPRLELARVRREREQLLSELGANLPALFWVRDARDGALIYANSRWIPLLGREPVPGEHFSQLFAVLHPEDRARVVDELSVAPGDGFDRHVRMVDAQGAVRRFHMRTFGIRSREGVLQRVVGLGEDVTEVAAALEALQASEAKYRNLFENTPVPMFRSSLQGDRPFLDVNRRFCELFEGSREELLQTPAATLWTHPDDRAQMARQIAETGAVSYEIKATTLKGNARNVWGYAVLYPEHGYLEGALLDLTERRKAERALVDSEARYRSVVQTMSDGIVVHAACGRIVTTNAAAERILGLSAEQIMGRASLDPRWRTVHEDGTPFPVEEHPGWVTLRTGQPLSGVTMGVHKPCGALTWLSVSSQCITAVGGEGAYAVVASFTDITEKRLADEKLRSSLREKEVMLREIHHRVKNNLQIVSSLLYLQSRRVEDPVLTELLRESQSRVTSMALIHQMLYESPELASIPFAAYASNLARRLVASYGVSGDRVAVQVCTDGVMLSLGTAVPCGLILNELVSNAVKHAFGPADRGTIQLLIERREGHYRVEVSDDGRGLPEDFEARARLSLGTKLVDRLVDQLAGQLERTSSTGGTRYVITFPVEEPG